MNSFLFRHQWLLLAFCWLLSGFFLPGLDMALHDNYALVAGWHTALAGSLFFVFQWSLQLIPVMRTLRTIYAIQSIVTTVSGIALLLFLFPVAIPTSDYSVYDEFDESALDMLILMNTLLTSTIITLVICQFAWAIQLIAFIVRRNTSN